MQLPELKTTFWSSGRMERNSENQNFPSPPTMMCRTGCGFYGSASNDGMCSKCFKDALKRKNQNPSPVQVVSATHLANSAASSMAGPSDSSVLGATSSCVNTTSVTTKVSPASSVSSMNLTTTPSVETATPTISTPGGNAHSKEKLDTEHLAAEMSCSPSPATSDDGSQDGKDKKPKKNRCHTCKKKVGLTGFMCRCGGLFCSAHRYSDMHECTFDYKEMAQEQIRKNNPVVVGQKVEKI